MAARIKTGDRVMVLAGKDKGRTGTVTMVIPKTSRAVVEGINMVVRHQRQTQFQQGGKMAKEAPIHLSNLSLIDEDGKPSRVGFKMVGEGETARKVRYFKRSGGVIDG